MIAFFFAIALMQRTVVPGDVGPNRLDPDASLLASAAPLRYEVSIAGNRRTFTYNGGLDDFRLHDENGAEHPYLVIAPPHRKPQWRAASILPIQSTKTTSGFEADLHDVIDIDRIRIDGIPAPFLKRLRVEGSGDRTRWTVLSADATLFDLPEQQLRNTEVTFSRGEFRYVRVTWDDRSSARVTHVGSVAAEVSDTSNATPAVVLPVSFRKIASESGKSRYRLTLPGAHLPVAGIQLVVTNRDVYRNATVTEGRLSGATVEPVALGASKLRRAERDDGVAEELTIPIAFPQGPDLELAIDDESNPPLSINGVVAIFAPLPSIYFESADRQPLTATYGDATLKPPVYDLEAHRAAVKSEVLARATWSASARVAAASAQTSATPLQGAPIKPSEFRFTRSIGPTQPGLTSLLLDADVLARSSALRDVRIAASDDHQVPYLVERRSAPITLPLLIPQRTRGEGTRSLYRFALPYDSLPEGTRLVLTTTARVFDRTVTLWRRPDETRGREREILETEAWRSSDPESSPPPLTFTASLAGVQEVELEIDEGDNAPLPIASAQLQLPSYALRFVSPGGPLTLLYGNASAAAPRYDLAMLAPRLFGEPARDVSLVRAAPMIATAEAGTERKIFWLVIAVAVIALLVTLSRLLSTGAATSS